METPLLMKRLLLILLALGIRSASWRSFGSVSIALLILLCLLFQARSIHAQVRGQYAPGINATNAGVDPEPGFTYANIFQIYSFSKLIGPSGERLPVNGKISIKVDHNIFMWVSDKKLGT